MTKKNESNKRNLAIAIVLVLTLIFLVVGITYAYFSTVVTGNEEASSITFDTGGLDLEFQSSKYITNKNGELINDNDRATLADHTDFSVTQSSNIPTDYNLYLTDITISANLKSPDFKWELLKDNSQIAQGTFEAIDASTPMLLTTTAQSIEANQTDNYILRVWLSETDQDQSSLYEGSFTAKVELSAVSK